MGMSRLRISALALAVLACSTAFAAERKEMSVTVKETQVRSTPSYMGKILGVLSYADRVTVLETRTGWAKVSFSARKLEGWVNLSALTDKKVELKSGAASVDTQASSGEVALAGKGFNAEVEAEYKKDGKIDYTWVDRMSKFGATPEQIASFLTQGGLSSPEGGDE